MARTTRQQAANRRLALLNRQRAAARRSNVARGKSIPRRGPIPLSGGGPLAVRPKPQILSHQRSASSNLDRGGNPINWAHVNRVNNARGGRGPGYGRSTGSGAARPHVGAGARKLPGHVPGNALAIYVPPGKVATQAMQKSRFSGGQKAMIGAAVVGAAAFAAYASTRRTGRDINNTLGNPASQITSWTTYNRASRGF